MWQEYLMGFVSFAVLSTLGELLAFRITNKKWGLPTGVMWRLLLWGIIGIIITLVFQIFNNGVASCMFDGYLPGREDIFALAILTSTTMNLLFAPTFMTFHRLGETYINLKCGELKGTKVSLAKVIKHVDWHNLFTFVFFKTIPLFWIPAHTIAFLIPEDYRVLMASCLSVMLGILLSLGKKRGE